MNTRLGVRGFTLIEMMVTVTILAILVGIAYPTYTSYVKRSNRGDAEAQLTRMAQAQERYRTTTDVYTASTTSLVKMGASAISPANPSNGANSKVIYNLTVTSPGATSTSYFQLQATPSTTQLNKNDGNLTLDSNGAKCWYKNGGTTCQSWSSN